MNAVGTLPAKPESILMENLALVGKSDWTCVTYGWLSLEDVAA